MSAQFDQIFGYASAHGLLITLDLGRIETPDGTKPILTLVVKPPRPNFRVTEHVVGCDTAALEKLCGDLWAKLPR